MGKRYLVVTKGQSGAVELHPLKQWHRAHPESLPGIPLHGRTSRQLRSDYKKRGWTVDETEQEVRLIQPEVAGDAANISILGEPEEEQSDENGETEFEFGLESDLREFIAANISTIDVTGKKLHLHEGRTGVEFSTGAGIIDILAADEQANFVVFELKLGRGPDRAMGQLLRYMGWVQRNLAKGKQVYGIIVAKSIDANLQYASVPVPNVFTLEYEIDFKLRRAALA